MPVSELENMPAVVLVVDDDVVILRTFARILERDGHEVITVSSGEQALAMIEAHPVDVVISDIGMPGLDGLTLLGGISKIDDTILTILVTGNPTMDAAMAAVEKHAYAFLPKPCKPTRLRNTVHEAVSKVRSKRIDRVAMDTLETARRQAAQSREMLERDFTDALDKLVMHYQPIVDATKKEVFGQEALVRSEHPTLSNPGALFSMAERLCREHELGRKIRRLVADEIAKQELTHRVFVNISAEDLQDSDLFDYEAPLSRFASSVVLEVSEKARTEPILLERLRDLRHMGYLVAVDDVGAGYAGLNSIAELEPEIIKLDMVLIRGIQASAIRQRLVRSMIVLAKEMNITVIAEGVETVDELMQLQALECDLFQGYFFAKPSPGMTPVMWPELTPAALSSHVTPDSSGHVAKIFKRFAPVSGP